MQTSRNSMCDNIEAYCKKKGFNDIRCFVITMVNGNKEYAICNDKEWLYGSSSSEAIGAYIDMMAIGKKYEEH